MRRASFLALLAAAATGCGGGGGRTGIPMDGGILVPPASLEPLVAFEGQERFVGMITAAGVDFSGAVVSVADGDPAIEIVAQLCNAARCGIVARMLDVTDNRGIAVPAPIDARNVFLDVVTPSETRRALVTIRPLDVISATGGSAPRPVKDMVFASSANVDPDAVLQAAEMGGPVRWIVFGRASIHGTVDVSGTLAAGRVGGGSGGVPGGSGAGLGGGAPGLGGAAGGGAGHSTDGFTGEGADGAPEAGGAGGEPYADDCELAFDAAECGGSGGGGASGEGGAGGGTFTLIALDGLELDGATFFARGAAAPAGGGGGGGSGGNVVVIGPSWAPPAEIDVAGGAGATTSGGAQGGGGASGVVEVETLGAAWDGATMRGPVVDLSATELVTESPTVVLAGAAPPTAPVHVERADGTPAGMTEADATGRFSLEVELAPGLNRFRVSSWTVVSWVGTSLEFSGTVPVGALVDIAYVPVSE